MSQLSAVDAHIHRPVAAVLATLLTWGRTGVRPRGDVVVAFVADEEDRGEFGAEWLVDEHPELFAGVEAAIGESGGELTLIAGRGGPAPAGRSLLSRGRR